MLACRTCTDLLDANGSRQQDSDSDMASWRALPLEVKSLILDAFIECVLQDEGYRCFEVYGQIAVYPKTKECSFDFVDSSSPQSEISTLMLTAPELQLEALELIDKKLVEAGC